MYFDFVRLVSELAVQADILVVQEAHSPSKMKVDVHAGPFASFALKNMQVGTFVTRAHLEQVRSGVISCFI
jgi:hypothetical protein